MNFLFLALTFLVQGDPETIGIRIRNAFEMRELVLNDYLLFDSQRGFHQYNDCNVLQMLFNENSSRLEKALAPVVYSADDNWDNQCAVLYAIVYQGVDRNTLIENRFARYWHGYNVLLAFALRVMEVSVLRRGLSNVMWLSMGALAIAAYRSGLHARRTGLAIVLSAAIFWAVPYFAPNFTHGPGDILVLLALTGMAAWPDKVGRPRVILPFSAAFGASVVFFEMLTGQTPIAAAWLAAMTLAIVRDEDQPEGLEARIIAFSAVIAFGLGAAATTIIKQILALALADPGAGELFLSHLSYYSSLPAPETGWPRILLPFEKPVTSSNMLTYGNSLFGYGLIAAIVITWLVSAMIGWRWRCYRYGRDILFLACIALVPVVWTLILPTHMYIHAMFMVRILVVPISIAPLALFWPHLQGNMGQV